MTEDASPRGGQRAILGGRAEVWGFLAVFAGVLCVLATTEAPALWTVFAHHDQYRYFTETLHDPIIKNTCETDRQYLWMYKIGRPLTAEIECAIFRHVTVPADLSPYRQAVLLLQCLGAAVFSATMRRCSLPWTAGGALGAAIYLLPGEQNAVFMANFANVIAPILALLGQTLLDAAGKGASGWPRTMRRVIFVAGAWACLEAALHLYPALTVFFFIPSFGLILFCADRYGWKATIRDVAFFCSAAVFYYVLLSHWYEPNFAQGQPVPPNYSIALATAAIMQGLLKSLALLSVAANFWFIYSAGAGGLAVAAVVILVIFAARDAAQRRRSSLINRIGGPGASRMSLLLALLAITNAVVVVSPVGLVYRVLVAQSAILLLWLFGSLVALITLFGLARQEYAERMVACVLLGLAAVAASWTVSENVLASTLERGYLRAVIANAPAGSFDSVVVIEPPSDGRGLDGRPIVGDEFNMPSSLGSSNLGSDVADMVRATMLELGRARRPIVDAACPMRSLGAARIAARMGGRIEVTAPSGWTSTGEVRGNLIIFPVGVIGVLSRDHGSITWTCGASWQDGQPSLDGSWRAKLDPAAIPVFRHPPRHIPEAPRTLIVDMGMATFPGVER